MNAVSVSEPGSATPRSAARPDTVGGCTAGGADCQDAVATQDGTPRSTNTFVIPQQVGRYRIDGVLGRGGMGVVLDAFDPELDRQVAIKLLRPERIGNEAPRRLLREAKVMARLSHRNVVAVFDAGIDEGRVFLAMERIKGQTARQWLARDQRSVADIVRMFVEAGRGLQVAHEAGITHRDFKLDNVLVADDGRVCVADFGVALNDETPRAEESDTRWPQNMALTRTGATVGTPLYMAPEQHAGSRVGPAADQFSFCVSMHRALYGVQPFAGETVGTIALSTLAGDYMPPADTRGTPTWLAAVVRRGLERDPAQRFDSMQTLLVALLDDPRTRRRRRVRQAGLAAVGVLALGATWLAGTAADAPCDGGQDVLARFWNDDTRAHMANADQARRVDAYANRWSEVHAERCEGHRAGEVSADGLDASMACLQQHRVGLEATVDLMTQTDTSEGGGAARALAQLPPPERCADAFWLAGGRDQSPSLRAAAQPLWDEMARAEALHHAGDLGAALIRIEALGPRFEALDDAPTTAAFALARGRLALEREDFEPALVDLRTAFETGLALGQPQLSVEGLARMLFVQSRLIDDPERLLDRAGELEALLDGATAPPDLRALAQNNLGAIAGALGRTTDARDRFEAATKHAEDSALVRPAERSSYALNLALVTADAAQRWQRFTVAEDAAKQAYGAQHPVVHNIATQRALHETDRGTARDQLRQLCSQDTVEHSCGHCFYVLGELEESLGDTRAAASAMDRSAACVPAPEHPYAQALRAKSLAYAHVLREAYGAALDQLDVATPLLEPQAALPWIASDLADIAVLRARVLRSQGEETAQRRADKLLREAQLAYQSAARQSFAAAPARRQRAVEELLTPSGP